MRVVIAFTLLALAACSGAETATGEANKAVPDRADSAPVAPASAQLTTTGITLTGDVEPHPVPFGTDRSATEVELVPLLGEPSSRDSNPECGAGPMEFSHYAGLTLNFQQGKFVGWSANAAPWLPGETRGEMAGKIEMMKDSTLGHEFTMGEGEQIVSGLFDGEGPDARVSDMWAGTNCIFR